MDTTGKQSSAARPQRTARPTLAALAAECGGGTAAPGNADRERRIARVLPGAAVPDARRVSFNSAL
ncbi:hypothetical protein ACFVGY_21065 [Streptomyces sp. NPDC127106]|uniref:hypothetical protein n=1 Tax=Streptomyces sp. NPDC127106 TaxID=3345360 RepID=UPI003631E1F2